MAPRADTASWNNFACTPAIVETRWVGRALAIQVNRLDPAKAGADGRLSWLHLVTPLWLAVDFCVLGWFLRTHPVKHKRRDKATNR